jgi:hypothetical protein
VNPNQPLLLAEWASTPPPLSLNEFFTDLAKFASQPGVEFREYELRDAIRLRLVTGSGTSKALIYCPVTAVLQLRTGQYRFAYDYHIAGRTLGLSVRDRNQIASAADRDLPGRTHTALRNSLRAAMRT